MSDTLNGPSLDLLFRNARTHRVFLKDPVPPETLHALYDLLKWGPTSSNCCPMRVVFLTTPQAKERLRPFLAAGNVGKTMDAPVTAIIANDSKFYEQIPRLSPHTASLRDTLAKDAPLAESTAMRNGSLQGAYFILAARALGLDCGPMSGFDNAKLDQEFFPDGNWKSNFLCNLGHGDASKLHPRGPRLAFEEACKIL